MTQPNNQPLPLDADDALRLRVLERVKTINAQLLTRLSTVANDLEVEANRAALGGLDGIEKQIETMRSFLLLLS
jgi:hypothetical protein